MSYAILQFFKANDRVRSMPRAARNNGEKAAAVFGEHYVTASERRTARDARIGVAAFLGSVLCDWDIDGGVYRERQ